MIKAIHLFSTENKTYTLNVFVSDLAILYYTTDIAII